MKTLIVELSYNEEAPAKHLESQLARFGASPIEGFHPVVIPAEHEDSTILLTMNFPDDKNIESSIRKLPGVVEVYGSPGIADFQSEQ